MASQNDDVTRLYKAVSDLSIKVDALTKKVENQEEYIQSIEPIFESLTKSFDAIFGSLGVFLDLIYSSFK